MVVSALGLNGLPVQKRVTEAYTTEAVGVIHLFLHTVDVTAVVKSIKLNRVKTEIVLVRICKNLKGRHIRLRLEMRELSSRDMVSLLKFTS
jgi:hypothetical protein